jgi:hypothetical protein
VPSARSPTQGTRFGLAVSTRRPLSALRQPGDLSRRRERPPGRVVIDETDHDAAARRLRAGELEARWNKALAHVTEVEGKIAVHDATTPTPAADPASFVALATDLKSVWTAPQRMLG